eukprot:TRINITY_DN6130_c0_g1_i1.p1 TRINITY_DN6130_c0_g1~~TRINITY_DN6130_c0_g1_i1.p1  ORF type:complete len:404 (-),score=109.56 TRINITY_DN6130_c0_g1_i1:86-1207(-)
MDAAGVLTVVTQLRALTQDEASRPYIARRGVLPGLRGFLDNSELKVVHIALEALRNLSAHKDNTEIVAKEPRMIDTLFSLFSHLRTGNHKFFSAGKYTQKDADGATDAIVECILLLRLEILKNSRYEGPFQDVLKYAEVRSIFVEGKMSPLRDDSWRNPSSSAHSSHQRSGASGSRGGVSRPERKKRADQKLMKIREANRRFASMYTGKTQCFEYEVEKLYQKAVRSEAESVLLSTKGIISFTIDRSRNVLSVFTKLTQDGLLDVLKDCLEVEVKIATHACPGVPSHEEDSIMKTPPSRHSAGGKENSDSPKYLTPEKADDEKAKHPKKNTRAILLRSGDDSLAARLARKQQEKQQSGGTGLLGGMLKKFSLW